MTFVLTTMAVLLAIPGLITAAHLGTLAVASLAYRRPGRKADGSGVRLLVLIPAHDEAAVITATLTALGRAQRPGDQVLLVADRCTDATADIARSHGALVLERGSDETPGRHAARQAGLDCARTLEWDAVVMIDADSIVEPDFLDVCARAIASGASAAQARSEGALKGGMVALTTLVAFTLQGVVVPRGRDKLGLCVRLRGTGMALGPRRRPRPPVHRTGIGGSRLHARPAARWHPPQAPRRRPAPLRERGRLGGLAAAAGALRGGPHGWARAFLPRLLARPTPARLEAALFLASPPFATASLLLVAATGLALAAGNLTLAAIAGAGVATLAATLVIGLVTSGPGCGPGRRC